MEDMAELVRPSAADGRTIEKVVWGTAAIYTYPPCSFVEILCPSSSFLMLGYLILQSEGPAQPSSPRQKRNRYHPLVLFSSLDPCPFQLPRVPYSAVLLLDRREGYCYSRWSGCYWHVVDYPVRQCTVQNDRRSYHVKYCCDMQ